MVLWCFYLSLSPLVCLPVYLYPYFYPHPCVHPCASSFLHPRIQASIRAFFRALIGVSTHASTIRFRFRLIAYSPNLEHQTRNSILGKIHVPGPLPALTLQLPSTRSSESTQPPIPCETFSRHFSWEASWVCPKSLRSMPLGISLGNV